MARPGEVGPRSSCPRVSSAGQQHPEPHPCARPPPSARSAHALVRGSRPVPRCARASPATPRLGGGRGRTGIRSAVRLAGAVQGQLAAAAVAAAAASSLWAAGRTGAAGRGRGRQAPPQLLAPAIPPGFRALGS